MPAPRTPALRVRAKLPADQRLVAIDENLRSNVVHDLLLFFTAAIAIVAALDDARSADPVGSAVPQGHLTCRNVDDHSPDTTSGDRCREGVSDLFVSYGR